MQTVAMYHSLIPRIVYGNMTAQEALLACEQEFFREMEDDEEVESAEEPELTEAKMESAGLPELDVNDVLAEITRMLEDHKE